ncbi:toxin RelE/ParE-like domain-containing protein [Desulfonema limicola]|uniref:Toxin RelE/ParE-like domain-containing protein n=1 Tax=Desulfonema limicola TaxID=45656 RepID=A0A975GH86_9BACT|nr:type II toxin-antitoxin system RelE/ParE family toxin [Desulfonema limicola]QTA81042.1 toxin RelE/ParE-like domain-containing protein [Desulfonema limicola]
MNKYRIFETEQFQKDIRTLNKSGKGKLPDKLRDFVYPKLRLMPHFGPNIKKLKGFRPETWRYRIGSWRFFYEIDEENHIVNMIAASPRSSAY